MISGSKDHHQNWKSLYFKAWCYKNLQHFTLNILWISPLILKKINFIRRILAHKNLWNLCFWFAFIKRLKKNFCRDILTAQDIKKRIRFCILCWTLLLFIFCVWFSISMKNKTKKECKKSCRNIFIFETC